MFDLKASEERKINKLKGWRERYSKKEYPYKVIMNLFYELFSIESIWNEINSAFSGIKQFENLSEGYSHIGGIKREYQLAQIHPNLESFIKNNKVAAGIKYSDFEEKIHKAQNGDNNEVIEIEFSYWFYCRYWEVTLEWAAYGYLGYDKHSAFKAVTGGGDVGGLKLDTFENAINFFNTIFGIVGSFQDSKGNSVDAQELKENQDIKYYPESFEILPDLWESTSSEEKKSGCFVATAVYGDYNSKEVIKLRLFRDQILSSSILGRTFISLYYFTGPFLAKVVNFFKLNKPIKKILDYFILKIDN